jgi:hypothetical protein
VQQFDKAIPPRRVWSDDHERRRDGNGIDESAAEDDSTYQGCEFFLEAGKSREQAAGFRQKLARRAMRAAMCWQRQFPQDRAIESCWLVKSTAVIDARTRGFSRSVPQHERQISVVDPAD